tara:strand:- start:204 stop:434 length:231 start_codon:yes stop_codon:yes gene_type:complete
MLTNRCNGLRIFGAIFALNRKNSAKYITPLIKALGSKLKERIMSQMESLFEEWKRLVDEDTTVRLTKSQPQLLRII